MTGGLDIRQDFSMIGIPGIFRLGGQVAEGWIVRPRLHFSYQVLRIQCCLYSNSSELSAHWKGNDSGSVLNRDRGFLAGSYGSLDNPVRECPELEKAIFNGGHCWSYCALSLRKTG